jgi:hypothetical protein
VRSRAIGNRDLGIGQLGANQFTQSVVGDHARNRGEVLLMAVAS